MEPGPCAVQDDTGFGLRPGDPLDIDTTLCKEVRSTRMPIVIDHASEDLAYRGHRTVGLYAIESYAFVPIVLGDGSYFGNLCAIDPHSANVSAPRAQSMFARFAEPIAQQFDSERRQSQLQAALLDEQAAAELREQLVAILDHDPRNPLSAIFGLQPIEHDQNVFVRPTTKVRRGPYCGAPTPMPVPSRSS